jgi:hypothetical protein
LKTALTLNPDREEKYRQLVTNGKPAKIAATVVMKKLMLIA